MKRRIFTVISAALLAATTAQATNHLWSSGDFSGTLATGDVITLTGNVTGNLNCPSGVASLTIDGGGNTLTGLIDVASDLALTLKDITVISSANIAINTNGASLTLAAEGSVSVQGIVGIYVDGNLAITGGSPSFTGTSNTGAFIRGNLTISGSAAPQFISTGTYGDGAVVVGNVTISSSGQTLFASNNATTDSYASALSFQTDGSTLTLNGSGEVKCEGSRRGICGNNLTIAGTGAGELTVSVTDGDAISCYGTGGTLTFSKTGGGINVTSTSGSTISGYFDNVNINGADVTLTPGGTGFGCWQNANVTAGSLTVNGNVGGNLEVSGGAASVTGNIGWDLTVSGGTVTIGGTVSGITTHTGGTINGQQLTATSIGVQEIADAPILSTQYCTLQGVAVKQPQAGQLYIVKEIRQSGKTTSELRFY